MNKYNSYFPSFRLWAGIWGGLLLVVFGGVYFFAVSAKTEIAENSTARNLTLGRLAVSQKNFSLSGSFDVVRTANADGTGNIALTGFPPGALKPTWSPDGTRIAFNAVGSGVSEIFVMNADGSGQTNLTNTMSALEQNPSWSVGCKIAYERDGLIWQMNADGANQTVFAGITQAFPVSPAWSPDGSKLAFASGGEIWVIDTGGTNERRVTINATTDDHPAWSPDGQKIIFTKGTSGIGVINLDGTNEASLTSGMNDIKPAWSPDGTTIAFVRRGTQQNGIYLMDVTGANQVRIIADVPGSTGNENDSPAWQPAGQTPNTFTISGRITRNNVSLSGVTVNLSGTINATATTDAAGNYQISNLQPGGSYTISPSFLNHYFTPPNRSFSNLDSNKIADFTASGVCVGTVCTQNGKIAFVRSPDIYTMNADGSDLTNITNSTGTNTDPNYSPDGSNMIFSTNRDGNYEIYRMNADGSNPMRLTNNTASDTKPYYSPDGASIVFVSDRDGNLEIYKMNSDGTNQVRLTNDTLNQNTPAFSPDGQKIIYITQVPWKLFTMNADGSNQQAFTDPNVTNYYYRPSYSPNGSKIILEYATDITQRTIFTMNADGTNLAPLTNRSHPQYSPDGTKVVHECCLSTFAEGIYTINADGNSNSSLRITTGLLDELPDWQPILVPRRTMFDFDGDGRSDVSVFRPSDGVWHLFGSQTGYTSLPWGLSTDVLAPADYDGDLKTDVAVWRASEGIFYILNSFDNTVRIENFGLAGDIPTGGDFDGDGKADLAVYRPGANGVFYYRGSMGNPQGNISSIPWGVSGDKPVAGDFDGDGKTDAAVYRSGIWYILGSSSGQSSAVNFGLADDTLVPADYDGDGKTDIAVYRDGIWYLLRSAQGFTAFQFGIANDIPAPADYDGDGRADASIYRDGVWWILNSQSGTAGAVSFGVETDTPVPSAFVR